MAEQRSGLGVVIAHVAIPVVLVGVAIALVDVVGLAVGGGATVEHALRCALADLVVGLVMAPAVLAERLLRRLPDPPVTVLVAAGAAVLVGTGVALVFVEATLGYAYGLGAAAPDAGQGAIARSVQPLLRMPVPVAAALAAVALPFVGLALLRARGARFGVQVATCAGFAVALSLPLLAAVWSRLAGQFLVGPGVLAPVFVAASAGLPLALRVADVLERRLAAWALRE